MADDAHFSFGGDALTTDSSLPADFSFGGQDPASEAKWHDVSSLPYTAPSWSDYGHALASSGSHVIAGLADAGASYERQAGHDDAADSLSKSAQSWQDTARRHDDKISPNARANLEAGITSGRFWQHPFSSSALQMTQQAPGLAAIAGAEVAGGPAGGIGAGALLGWAGRADALHDKVFGTDDVQLRNENSNYDSWRASGMSENDAKSRLISDMFSANHGDLAAAAIGGVAGLAGPAGRVTGGVTGLVGKEASRWYGRAGQGALEGFLTGAGQTALTDYALGVTEQQYNVGGMPSVEDIAKGALGQGALFGVMGGVGGALSRAHGRAETKEPTDITRAQPVVGDTRDPTPPPARPVETVGKEVTGDTPTGASDQAKKTEAKQKQADPVGGENVSIPSSRWGKKPIQYPADIQKGETPAGDTGKPAPSSPITDDATRQALTEALPQQDQTKAQLTTDSGAEQQAQPVQQPPSPAPAPPVRSRTVPETSQEQPQVTQPVRAPPPTSKSLRYQPPRTDLTKTEIPSTPELPVVKPEEAAAISEIPAVAEGEAAPEQPTTATTPEPVTAPPPTSKGLRYQPKEPVTPDLKTALPIVGEAQREIAQPTEEVTPKTKKGKAAVAQRVSNNRTAEQIVERHQPTEMDARALLPDEQGGVGSRNVVRARLAAMVAEAEKAGVKIPKLFREPKSDLPPHSNALILLDEAQKFLARKAPDTKEYEHFLMRENDIRQGRREDVLQERKTEAEIALAKQKKGPRAITYVPEEAADRVAAAREHIEEPTEAQAEAGNYAKGHPGKLEGQEVTIETPSGGTRKGTDETGRKWESVSKTDYGYILNTKGADGDHVDVYVGPKGETGKIFVMNQLDPATGEFDEHKVFIGYDTAMKALADYRQNYDEPKSTTNSRIGEVVPMDRKEFNDWLHNGDLRQPVGEGISGGSGTGTIKTSKGSVTPHSKSTVGEEIQDITPKGFKSAIRPAINILINKIGGVAKNVPIYMISGEEMERIAPGENAAAFYDPKYDHIIVNSDSNLDLNYALLHEAFHAATVRVINANKGLRNLVDRLWKEADPNGEYESGIEFLTHLMTDPETQEKFAHVKISDELANDLDIAKWRRRTIFEGVLAAIQKAFGLGPRDVGAIEAAMSITERTLPQRKEYNPDVYYLRQIKPARVANDTQLTTNTINKTKDLLDRGRTEIGDKVWRKGLGLLPTSTIRSWFEDHFSAGTMRAVQEGMERINAAVRKNVIKSDPALRELAELRNRDPEEYNRLTELMHDSSTFGVHPDSPLGEGHNDYIKARGKIPSNVSMEHMQAIDMHPELQSRFNQLKPPTQALFDKLRTEGVVQRAKDIEATRTNLVYAMQKSLGRDDQLNEIIHKGRVGATLTPTELRRYDRYHVYRKLIEGKELDDEDMENFGKDRLVKAFQELDRLKDMKGPYFPNQRFGDYVVTGRHDFKVPSNGTRLTGDESNHVVFNSRPEMYDFVTKLRSEMAGNPRLVAEPEIRYYYPETGDPNNVAKRQYVTSQEVSKTQGKPIQEFRVRVQDTHFELAESKAEAEKRADAMREANIKDVSEPMLRRDNPDINYGLQGRTINSLHDAADNLTHLSAEEKDAVHDSINHVAVVTMRGNRLSKSMLRRNNVAGADSDMIRSLDQRRMASAVHQAYAEHMPAVTEAMDKLRGEIETTEQSILYRELSQRIGNIGKDGFTTQLSPTLRRLQTVGYLKYLISPANTAMHLTHPTLVSIPEMAKMKGENLASVHARTMRMYKMMGGVLPTVGKGIKGFKEAWDTTRMPTDFVQGLMDTMQRNGASPELMKALNEGIDIGVLHTTGFDFSTHYDVTGLIDRGLAKVRNMSQELTSSVDAINRVGVFSSAFQQAMEHGYTYEKALNYAKDTTSETLGLFSATNRARAFQLPIVRSVLQFKMIPMMIYNILMHNMYQLIKGESSEAKWMALKGMAGMMGTSFALAGLSGAIPEPVRLAVTVGNMLGVNDSYQEQEDKLRKGLANSYSPELAGLMMDGLSGMAGADMHHRFGVSDLMLFGEPQSNHPSDIMNWVYGLIGGVPAGLGNDAVTTMANIRDGKYEQALESGIPVKGITDIMKAMREYSEGKPTASGMPGMAPLGPFGAVVQALGWTPEQVSRYGEAKHVLTERRQEQADMSSEIRRQFLGGDRAGAIQRLKEWNLDNPDSPMNVQSLLKAEQQAKGSEAFGQKITPRNREMLEELKRVYLQ